MLTKTTGPVGGMPVGTVIDFAGPIANIPAGYLNCDGAAVSRTTYALLFAAVGVLWGVGDGSTTFNLPSLSRRVTVGSGGTGTGILGNAVGDIGGEESHVQTVAEMALHTHTGGTGAMNANATHHHNVGWYAAAGNVNMTDSTYLAQNCSGVTNYAREGATNQNTAIVIDTNIDHAHNFTTNSQGNSNAFNVVQPSAVMLKIIRTGL